MAVGTLVVVSTSVWAMPKAKDVAVRVWVQGSGSSFRHRVYVSNKSETRQIQAVAVGLRPGLREAPGPTSGPLGWRARVVRQTEGVWAVEFSCGTRTLFPAAGPALSEVPDGDACGILPGQTLSFDVVLFHRSPSLEVGPVGIVYSDGEEALALP